MVPSDAANAPAEQIVRAEVLMRAGDKAAALDLLEQLAAVPYGPSYGELLRLPWDRLRSDARFDAIVQQLAIAAKR